jgi:hypothetical protein
VYCTTAAGSSDTGHRDLKDICEQLKADFLGADDNLPLTDFAGSMEVEVEAPHTPAPKAPSSSPSYQDTLEPTMQPSFFDPQER